MNRHDLGVILANQLIACMGDRNYGYSSTTTRYSHLTENGKAMLIEMLDGMASIADDIRQKEIRAQAENLMLDQLKK